MADLSGTSTLSGGGTPDSTGGQKITATTTGMSGGGDLFSDAPEHYSTLSGVTGGGYPISSGAKSTAGVAVFSGGGAVFASSKKHIVSAANVSGGGNVVASSGRYAASGSSITSGGSIFAEGRRVGYTYVFPTPVSMYATVTQVRLRIVARTLSKDSDTFTVKLVKRTTGVVLDTIVVPISSWERRSKTVVSVTRSDLMDGINAQIELPTGSVMRLNQFVLEAIGRNT